MKTSFANKLFLCGTALAVGIPGHTLAQGQFATGGWTNRYNGPGNSTDIANAVAVDGSANVFVTGYSTDSGSGSDYTTIKYSSGGCAGVDQSLQWTDTASGQAVLSFRLPGLKLAFARDGERLLAVHGEGASAFHAPGFEKLQFDWLKERPSAEAPAYLGPNTSYARPDRP